MEIPLFYKLIRPRSDKAPALLGMRSLGRHAGYSRSFVSRQSRLCFFGVTSRQLRYGRLFMQQMFETRREPLWSCVKLKVLVIAGYGMSKDRIIGVSYGGSWCGCAGLISRLVYVGVDISAFRIGETSSQFLRTGPIRQDLYK